MHEACDLIVLGAGSGGLACALRAAKHGARVVLFDPAVPGGTCVHRGCVPKKALWFASQLAWGQQLARDYGFDLVPGALDWEGFRQIRQRYVDGITGRYAQRLAEVGVQRVALAARLRGGGVVEDASGARWQAPHVVVATGGQPRRPAIPGGELGWVSDDLFTLHELPRRIAVVGGGYVAVEFAGLLHALGCEVSLFVRDRLLPSFDAELVDALAARMADEGIRVHRPMTIRGAAQRGQEVALACDGHGVDEVFDGVLWAVGRHPNSGGLGLEALGVDRDAAGHIRVDDAQDTSVPGIHALGDVTDRRALTPVAVAAGRCLAERLFGGAPDARLDDSDVPSVVFADTPLGGVGLDEACARARHGDAVRVHRSRFTPMQLALVGRQAPSLMKLVCVGEEERVVGIHALGPGVEEMLQGFAVALKRGVCKRDLDATVAIHPTSAEEMVLMD